MVCQEEVRFIEPAFVYSHPVTGIPHYNNILLILVLLVDIPVHAVIAAAIGIHRRTFLYACPVEQDAVDHIPLGKDAFIQPLTERNLLESYSKNRFK